MKKITTIIIAGLLNIYPLKVGLTQVVKPDSIRVNKKEAEIKSKIAANIDTALTNIVNQKTAIIQKKQDPVKKPKTRYRTITDTLYIDTCFDKVPQQLFPQMPVTVEKPKVEPPSKKLKWIQFKKRREEKKQKNLANTDSTKSP